MTEPTGRVLQVNVSPGGVPKLPVERAWVSNLGLEGDKHHDFTEHGGPHRAVCLFAIEVIERLQSEGHPVEPGSVGENLTTIGVEWSLLPVGTRARIGDVLELEIASSTTPCATQTHNFSDGKFSRINIDRHPSDSRMYARVLREGEVKPGDPIAILPPLPDSRAQDELLLKRLDRAEAQSALAAWRAAADAGFDVRIVADGEIFMAASPDIPGPAYNHAAGLARLPNLIPMATDFFDKNACDGWLITDSPPWPGAKPGLVLGVFVGLPESLPFVPMPDGFTVRPLRAHEGKIVQRIYRDAGSVGDRLPGAPDPWPQVYSALVDHPHRTILIAEDAAGTPVALCSLHTHNKAGWLRGAAVVPGARGRGLQRALISERVRLAIEKGCDLVGAAAEPGSVSARNLEAIGMRQIGIREDYRYWAVVPGRRPEVPAEP